MDFIGGLSPERTIIMKIMTQDKTRVLNFKMTYISYVRSSGGTNMDYKKETIEILQKVNDDSLLEFFYRFIARVIKNRGY